ncbi:magnesium-protoporphyrin IX monomethyl ester anaerobic oxidative cyclase [Sphingomonas lenta]|uniref:Magnesium-protoporphyrin IX monomethyl ester anaerobic oxidative cyclase n=1 Tax=Sphingomonas lenta TaxID=1141887 RepID=A0A2A2SHT0_9SPHN|nr:magnesium-protoporphyrin IX monomethyl ester anaerobic oxidative cyclase [Sphingomonas lenta]PAX08775.1 magnesium-protoporphyrin IX monomethyl ester anaerobic oxidative cyclase [Sphingomonas lenta]
MRIVIVNIPHPAIGSRIPKEQLPPLGLLCIGGPLIDDGHDVQLVDGEFGPMTIDALTDAVVARAPDAVLFGHSGSSSAQPIISRVAAAVAGRLPSAKIVYGGVHPTYFWREILAAEPHVHAIVRGEGEETARRLMRAFERGEALDAIPGIAFRRDGEVVGTPPAPVIIDLDAYRIGWELIDHRRYSYWGGKRAVVIQFSRGCPHLCNYCGQRGFWTRWRHRDPVRLAREIAHLHREHGVEVFNFADENPSAGRKPWRAFLEALIAEDVSVTLVGSTRADDIVRDADILHLYKRAGFERFLLGMENTDEATLKLIRKGGATTTDREAIRLLRQHGILSMVTWVAGFDDQTDVDLWRGLKQLVSYDADQIQALYVTPHRWTPFYRLAADRPVVQADKTKWDYKHQVLGMQRMPPWRLFLWVKLIEAVAQLRPRALLRWVWHPDPKIRHAIRWYYRMGRRVWVHEVLSFLFRDRHARDGLTVADHLGDAQDHEEEALRVVRRGSPAAPRAVTAGARTAG